MPACEGGPDFATPRAPSATQKKVAMIRRGRGGRGPVRGPRARSGGAGVVVRWPAFSEPAPALGRELGDGDGDGVRARDVVVGAREVAERRRDALAEARDHGQGVVDLGNSALKSATDALSMIPGF